MPTSALLDDNPDLCLPLSEIPGVIIRLSSVKHVRRVDPSRLFAGEPTRVSGGREIASIVAKSMVGRGGRAKGSFGGYALNMPLRCG